ncbi:MAG: hypothetical protein RLP16_04585 [Alphaproteobacteria bacterium]
MIKNKGLVFALPKVGFERRLPSDKADTRLVPDRHQTAFGKVINPPRLTAERISNRFRAAKKVAVKPHFWLSHPIPPIVSKFVRKTELG